MGDDDPVLGIEAAGSARTDGAEITAVSGRLPRHRHGRARADVIAVIALGGMLGATARFKFAEAMPTAPGRFPWATFLTNLSGSFVLGFLLVVLLERFSPTRYLRPFLATGVIGAFTTMSTYMVETAVLIKDGYAATGLLYGVGSLIAGLFLAYAGVVAARLTPQRHHHQPRTEEWS